MAVLILALPIAGCGSGSASGSASTHASATNPSESQATRQAVSFSRCMRSHGVPSFPDPKANGQVDFRNIAGVNTSSPAFTTAENACKSFLPVKRPPSTPPSPQAYTRLLHWSECMRRHGISGLPDPKPNPPPGPGSSGSNHYGTLMGDGGYWVGIPSTIDAHSPAFMHLSTVCGESPTGPTG